MNSNIKIRTEDGSDSLHSKKFNENYHSVFGAVSESLHVYIQTGFQYIRRKEVSVFEMGFGTGLNAFLTFIESEKNKIRLIYTTIELFPLNENEFLKLNYPELVDHKYAEYFNKLHQCRWNEMEEISEYFAIKKIKDDILKFNLPDNIDVVYYDAFSPDVQPELWTLEIFRKLYSMMNDNAVLTTYSAKGFVKRNLKHAGFLVELLPGPKGKRHITRAVK